LVGLEDDFVAEADFNPGFQPVLEVRRAIPMPDGRRREKRSGGNRELERFGIIDGDGWPEIDALAP